MPSDDTPLDIFFDFLKNSAGRFISLGDSDLALRGVYGALSGRFRVFSKPLPGLGLEASGAFGALSRGKFYLYKTGFYNSLYTLLGKKTPQTPHLNVTMEVY